MNTVGKSTYLPASGFTEGAINASTGPVAYNHRQRVAGQNALYAQKGPGGMCRVSILVNILLMEEFCYLKSFGIIDEGTVNTSLIGAFQMDKLIAALLHVPEQVCP